MTRACAGIVVGVALLALTLAAPALADELTIGTNNGGNVFPFGDTSGSNPGTRYQQVYDGDQFSGPVSITGISFFLSPGAVGTTFRTADFEVRLSTSNNPVDALSSTFGANVGGDDQLFQSFSLSGAAGDVVINGSAFAYDPTNGDLLVDLLITNIGVEGSASFQSMSNSAGGLFSRMHDFDSGFSNYGLVTRFTFGSPAVPEPATLALVGLGVGALAMRRRRRKTA